MGDVQSGLPRESFIFFATIRLLLVGLLILNACLLKRIYKEPQAGVRSLRKGQIVGMRAKPHFIRNF